MHISDQHGESPAPVNNERPYLGLFLFLTAGLSLTALVTGFWTTWAGPDLLGRADNPRRFIDQRYSPRGEVLDRHGSPILTTTGEPGSFERQTVYPPLSNVLGYNHPRYGQSGLEASMDHVLRGLQGQPPVEIWLSRLLYGQPPPGLDVRVSLDLEIEQIAEDVLGERNGALVLLNAREGRILAMVSHPGFNSNQLEQVWDDLIADEDAPLLNRATQGRYQPGTALAPFFLAASLGVGEQPALPEDLDINLNGLALNCAAPLEEPDWSQAVAAGCPAAQLALGEQLGPEVVLALYRDLGLYQAPQIYLPAAGSDVPEGFSDQQAAFLGQEELLVSPLQMALAASAMSANGLRPAATLVTAVETPEGGFQTLAPLAEPQQVLKPESAREAAGMLTNPPLAYWQSAAITPAGGEPEGETQYLTWYLAGTAPDWEGVPLTLALVVETADLETAVEAGQAVMEAALGQ